MYLRMVIHSDSNVDLLYSNDGLAWKTFRTAVNPGFTLGVWGLCVTDENGGKVEAWFDWARFT